MCVKFHMDDALRTYSLEHGVLDPPSSILLHPGLLDDDSASLPGHLSEEGAGIKRRRAWRRLQEALQWPNTEHPLIQY